MTPIEFPRGPFSPLIERALRVAAHAHRHQTRKSSDVPYVSHLAGVALILCRAGFDEEAVLAAALLHDAVEDTDCSVEMLADDFPPEVVAWVAATTERKADENGRKRPWEDRKREHLAQVAAAPLEARAIVLADKLHNLGSMLFDLAAGERLWERFNAPRERILWYHREMIDHAGAGAPRLEGLANACRELLARLEAACDRSA
ncbi:MAG TPA: HD domain-containing protein [Planctomycetaceae bacterium]|nr:HD domain-containing protein [Planctomycetaceae bacterium]